MRYCRIIEDADDVGERVGLAKRHERRGIFLPVFLQAADIHVFDRGERDFLGLEKLRELRNSRIGNTGNADMSLSRLRARFHARSCEDSKQTCLADLRQSYNSSLHEFVILARARGSSECPQPKSRNDIRSII